MYTGAAHIDNITENIDCQECEGYKCEEYIERYGRNYNICIVPLVLLKKFLYDTPCKRQIPFYEAPESYKIHVNIVRNPARYSQLSILK